MGIRHGIGKFIWADGSTYQGEFQDNKVHKYLILYPRNTEMELIILQVEANMLESGLKMNNMAKEAEPGLVNIHF